MKNTLGTVLQNINQSAEQERSNRSITTCLSDIAANTENTHSLLDSNLFVLITLLKKALPALAQADLDSASQITKVLQSILAELSKSEIEDVSINNFKELSTPLQKSLEAILLQLRDQKPPVVNVPESVVNVKAPIVNVPAPIVNVPAAVVNVPAPIVNVPKTVVNVPELNLLPLIRELRTQLANLRDNSVGNPLAVRMSDGQAWIDELKDLTEKISDTGDKVADSASKMSVWTTSSRSVFLRNAFGIRINPKTEDSYALRVDDATTTNITYVGKAAIGSDSAAAVWSIKKIDQTGTPVTTVITYANGNNNFSNIWDNRTSLTYS